MNLSKGERPIDKRNRLIVLLGVFQGLRINEISNINIEDLQEKDGDHIIYLLRKGYESKDNYTILTPKMYALILEYIGDRTEGSLLTNFKFGGSVKSDTIGRVIKSELLKVGIDSRSITAHSLRTTFARLVIDTGTSIVHLSKAMNHKNISTTMGYLHNIDRHEHSAEKAIHLNFDGE